MTRKVFLNLLMVCILAFGFVPIVHAEGPSVAPKDRHSGLDPNYKPTQAELDKSAAKEKAAEEYANAKMSGIIPMTTGGTLNVGSAEQFRELPGEAQRNYCGPSSTQVAIRARTTNIPDIEDIATRENIDVDEGVWVRDITPAINYYLNSTWYVTSSVADQTGLQVGYKFDIDNGYGYITALTTLGMPGWGVTDVAHIVTVYAYDLVNGSYLQYVDTSSEYAGHYYAYGGSYFNYVDLSQFWTWVARQNIQSW